MIQGHLMVLGRRKCSWRDKLSYPSMDGGFVIFGKNLLL